MIYVTRKEHFNAAHKLSRPEWSPEKNFEVFGKCANPNWHGHNFDLHITIKGVPNETTGFVMNLKTLSQLIREHITEKLDHKNLNLDVDFMKGIMPSIENLAVKIWEEFEPHILERDCQLHAVKLFETENNFVEYFGK